MNFEQAFQRVIGHEGGYVNNPRDPGGETKFGISKRAYPNLNIASLTLGDAKEIYRRDYWGKLQLDQVPETVRFDVFDTAVNSGVAASARILQRAAGVKDDGIIGPKSIAAIKAMNPQLLDKKFNGYRLMYLTDLKPWPDFSRGWVKRVATNLIED